MNQIIRHAIALIAGLLMGLGMLISGMANPQKVLGFLDISGAFDPSLALVMLAALAVTGAGYWAIKSWSRPLAADEFYLPMKNRIDRRLIIGSALFGTGWGLVGYCPGPALVSISALTPSILGFVGAMFAGMLLHDFLLNKQVL